MIVAECEKLPSESHPTPPPPPFVSDAAKEENAANAPSTKEDLVVKPADDSKTAETSSKADHPLQGLSDENKALLQTHKDMISRYSSRAEELVEGARGGLEEEHFDMPPPLEDETSSSSSSPSPSSEEEDPEYPDQVVANMALWIEGRCVRAYFLDSITDADGRT